MVVVLVVIARTATPAMMAEVLFSRNGWAANIAQQYSGWTAPSFQDQQPKVRSQVKAVALLEKR